MQKLSPPSHKPPGGFRLLFGAKVLGSAATALLLWLSLICIPANPQDSSAPKASKGQPSSEPRPATTSLDLSDEVVQDVLTNLQRGLETHNLDRTLSVFDPDGMTDYPAVRDQMRAFFRLHDNIKFRYQLLQVSAENGSGSATADVEMDPEPADILPTERRRTAQMRFQLKRTPAGWKVISLKPMDFFS